MEAARELVVDTATRHFLEGSLRNGEQLLVLVFLIALENQLDRGSVRKLWRLAEPTISGIKEFGDRLDLRIDHAWVELRFCAVKCFRLRYRVSQGIGSALEIRPLIAIRIGHSQQDAAKTRPAALIVGREISAPIKRFAVRK